MLMVGGATTGDEGVAGARDSAGDRTGRDKSGAFTTGGAIVGNVFGVEPDDDETGCGVGIGSTGGKFFVAGGMDLVDGGLVGKVAEGIPAPG